jgi:hypothetical protein
MQCLDNFIQTAVLDYFSTALRPKRSIEPGTVVKEELCTWIGCGVHHEYWNTREGASALLGGGWVEGNASTATGSNVADGLHCTTRRAVCVALQAGNGSPGDTFSLGELIKDGSDDPGIPERSNTRYDRDAAFV